ncbi:MAG: L-serine ammonia-lyase, iron-sulfur-dependent, subunit alpha [Oscillospiraceae bacterium]|nr:L-serine ammonia-lyase, iron-sulfur-dependent, subunit alpha [Oscillospiraceae bacterium]
MDKKTHDAYVRILKTELVPAFGCTEPISIAYAAAKARALLGAVPEHAVVTASGNIIKNVKSVVVPGTGGLRGIEAAAAAGFIAGDESLALEVIEDIPPDKRVGIRAFSQSGKLSVRQAESELVFDLSVEAFGGGHSALVRIINDHTNIVLLRRDSETLFENDTELTSPTASVSDDKKLLCMQDIYDFAEGTGPDKVRSVLERQIEYNRAISDEGLSGNWGANIGRVILSREGECIRNRARAAAAAGSDARMAGCEKPVVINSGSGNQGITVSLPIIVYAEELGAPREKLLRALALANLVAIYEKVGIGTLSAYCGAVSAGCAAGAGIAYLKGGDFRAVAHTLVNSLAITSGIVCDGAKASCAAKIATSVDAGILGYEMYLEGKQFYGGDGFVKKGVDNTIRAVGRLGSSGMKYTEKEILDIMLADAENV